MGPLVSDLDADIARIAAMRGRPVVDYQVAERLRTYERRGMGHAEVLRLAEIPPDWRAEMRRFDALPRWSRALLVNAPVMLSAIKYAELLERCEDEAWLIRTVESNMPILVRRYLAKAYSPWPTHPRLEDEDDGRNA